MLANGCATDEDNDTVPDGCDKCPNYDDRLDGDGDRVPDDCDNCPSVANVDQADADQDGPGDACDNCPHAPNGDQANLFGGAMGDVCEAASSVMYSVALGGDNHNGTAAFTPGSLLNGQAFPVNSIITWEIRGLVDGLHSHPGQSDDHARVIGLAAMVVNVELRENTADGNIVQLGAGSATARGWFSNVNDGQSGRPVAYAALCRVFDLDRNSDTSVASLPNTRPFGGPGLEIVQYPSLTGNPPGAVVTPGVLTELGAVYRRFQPDLQWVGVGIPEQLGLMCLAPNALPLFEGQINTSGLPAGVYVLRAVPVAGNVLLGEYYCAGGTSSPLARPADVLYGDTITFELVAPP
jgi:hypothetical protein